MFFKTSTTTILVATAIAAVQAVDVRFYPDSTTCGGNFIACNTISSSQCCNAGRVYRSQNLGNIGRAIGQQAFELASCSSNGAGSSVGANGCHRPPFQARSGRWVAPSSRVARDDGANKDCLEADTFGFIDESGAIREGKLSVENREVVEELFVRGDVEGLKALL